MAEPRGRHAAGPDTPADEPDAVTDEQRIAVDDPATDAIPVVRPPGLSGRLSQALGRIRATAVTRARATPAALVPRLPRLTLAIAGGLLLCVSFPPFGWWFTAPVAFALLTVVITRPTTSAGGAFGYGFLFGLVCYIPLLPWISGLVGALPWLALAAVCALFPGLFGAAAWLVRELPGWPVWFAVLWVAQEWLKCTVPFGGFPWGVVAFGQTNGPLLPIVRVGGAPLLSLAVALLGIAAAALVLEVVRWWQDPQRDLSPPAVILPGLAVCVVLLGTAAAWPAVRQAGSGAGNDPLATVAAVQGNVPRLGLEFNAQRRAVLDNHVAETMRLAADVRAGRAPQPQLVIWPENSSDIDPVKNADAAAQIDAAADAIGAPILVGGVLARPEWTPERPATTNSVIVWTPENGPGERHDKRIIQPFGEYLPMRGFFRLLSPYADRAGYFVPGDGDGVVTAAGTRVGVTTCWEVIFDRAARQSVLAGAQLLAVPTNNATFDEAMSQQQLAFARGRAVEHDRYTVVAGTTGISAVIAPDGRELDRTAFFEPAYLDRQIHLKTALTPATRFGPALQAVLVALGGAVLVAAVVHNGSFARAARRLRSGREAGTDGAGHPSDTTEHDAAGVPGDAQGGSAGAAPHSAPRPGSTDEGAT
ncbi:apolipoprotein N-acyltransferase [Mycobacterium sp. MYCO198283]|uniref:apolipoprotein N-acyltransferase n=1 Tax=Mycobacterium sp. MYCO198283 TaxID=2883505 RepID=UPI001E58501E|nr:apolipoprotein N-acyltransferase [Mycobacterium sp. MYCO198283]MCG5433382.1 apolipoprotein N-acyltransferase [Mycobacterium sp. MYCO198283]